MALFASKGPSSDSAGTGQILDATVFADATLGQRVGTAGGGPLTNVTLAEWFLELSADDGTRARINGDATQRRWASAVIVFSPGLFYRQSIAPIDTEHFEDVILPGLAAPTGIERIDFRWNEGLARWEAYDGATLIAHNSRTGFWVEV